MDGGGSSGGGGSEGEKKKPSEGEVKVKVKRKMKTAKQLEVLEKTYAVETYPSDALRSELSVQLGLSDRQLQMWVCHRRLKDRKGESEEEVENEGDSLRSIVRKEEQGGDLEEFVMESAVTNGGKKGRRG